MKQVRVVIGAGYGDEGKGHVVNALAQEADTVVRFNGGAQAAHTVHHHGRRHVFHSFGSATLQEAATHLGPRFLFDPVMIRYEERQLSELRYYMSVDPDCPVVTPFDVQLNRKIEESRGGDRHGSCGMGIGETMRRHEGGCPVTVADICKRNPRHVLLKVLTEWYEPRINELGLDARFDQSLIEYFIQSWNVIREWVKVEKLDPRDGADLVFEGAQGLFLDQNSPDFPHVTYSNTGLDNVIEMLDPLKHALSVYYVSRPYLTRHGNGPLAQEFAHPLNHLDPTNPHNDYQGTIRYAPLDFTRMRRDISADVLKAVTAGFAVTPTVALTCCDQIDDVLGVPPFDFIREVRAELALDVLTFWAPDCRGRSLALMEATA